MWQVALQTGLCVATVIRRNSEEIYFAGCAASVDKHRLALQACSGGKDAATESQEPHTQLCNCHCPKCGRAVDFAKLPRCKEVPAIPTAAPLVYAPVPTVPPSKPIPPTPTLPPVASLAQCQDVQRELVSALNERGCEHASFKHNSGKLSLLVRQLRGKQPGKKTQCNCHCPPCNSGGPPPPICWPPLPTTTMPAWLVSGSGLNAGPGVAPTVWPPIEPMNSTGVSKTAQKVWPPERPIYSSPLFSSTLSPFPPAISAPWEIFAPPQMPYLPPVGDQYLPTLAPVVIVTYKIVTETVTTNTHSTETS